MALRASIWRLILRSMSLIFSSRSASSSTLSLPRSSPSRASRTRSVSLGPLAEAGLADLLVLLDHGALEQGPDLAPLLVLQDRDLVVEVALHDGDLFLLDDLGPRALLGAAAGEDADVDDGALDTGGAVERGVLDVQGLLAEDGLEQLLLGGELGLALGRDLADQDVAGLDVGPDPDDAVLVQVAEQVLGDVGDVAGDLFGAQLGVAGLDGLLDDVQRGEDVPLDQLLRDDDGVLEVIAAPGHEAADDVAAQGQLAAVGAGAVGQDLAAGDPVAAADDRPLGQAGVLVGPQELGQGVEVGQDVVLAQALGVVHPDQDALGVDELDHTGALGHDDVARALGRQMLHAGADPGRFGRQERHGLTLHVRAHQGAVGVVVLQEGDQGRGQRDQLLGRDVDVVDLLGGQELEVAGLAGRDQVAGKAALLVDRGVGLGDVVLLVLPGGQVEAVRLEDGQVLGPLALERGDFAQGLVLLDDLADLALAVAGVQDLDVVDDPAVP